MDFHSSAQYVVFLVLVTILVQPLGGYLERVFSRRRTAFDRVVSPIENAVYGLTGVDPAREMSAREYGCCFLMFGLTGTLLLYGVLRLQRVLPWFFPEYQTTPLSPDLSFNTAVSFSTTTTWQAYAGETTMSYVSQMVGLCAQNFLAGAAGLAVGMAFIRGFARDLAETIGNFWVDLTRGLLWILLPGALMGAVVLIWQGVPMNFHDYTIACLRSRWDRSSSICCGSGAGDIRVAIRDWDTFLSVVIASASGRTAIAPKGLLKSS